MHCSERALEEGESSETEESLETEYDDEGTADDDAGLAPSCAAGPGGTRQDSRVIPVKMIHPTGTNRLGGAITRHLSPFCKERR